MKHTKNKLCVRKNAKKTRRQSKPMLARYSKKTIKKQLIGGTDLMNEEIHGAINKLIDPKTDFKGNFDKLCHDNQISSLFQNANYCDIAAINQLNKAGLYKSLYEFIKSTNDGNNGNNGNDIDDSEIASMSSELNKYNCSNKPTKEEHKKVLNATVDKITSDNKKITEAVAYAFENNNLHIAQSQDTIANNSTFTTDKSKITTIITNIFKNIIKAYFGLKTLYDCETVYKLKNLFELLNFFKNDRNKLGKNEAIIKTINTIILELLIPIIRTELETTGSQTGAGSADGVVKQKRDDWLRYYGILVIQALGYLFEALSKL